MYLYGCALDRATKKQIYGAVCTVVRGLLQERQRVFAQELYSRQKKQVYYLSMEFLVGKNLKNNLFQLGLTEQMAQALGRHRHKPGGTHRAGAGCRAWKRAALADWRPATWTR